MTNKRYTEEFKIEEVKQITERAHAAAVAAVSVDNLPIRVTTAFPVRGSWLF